MKTRKIHQTIIDGVTGRIIDFDATVTEPDANALPGPTAAATRQGGNRHATPKQEPQHGVTTKGGHDTAATYREMRRILISFAVCLAISVCFFMPDIKTALLFAVVVFVGWYPIVFLFRVWLMGKTSF